MLYLRLHGLNVEVMKDILSNIYPDARHSLKALQIPTFQLITSPAYAPKMNITDMTNNTYFLTLEMLDVSDNSLTVLHSGFTRNMPNLKMIDIS